MENNIVFKIVGYDKNFICLHGHNDFFERIDLFGYADLKNDSNPLDPKSYQSTFELKDWKEPIEILGDINDLNPDVLRNDKFKKEHIINLEIVPCIEETLDTAVNE